jgi:hypothetical protein
VTPNDARKILLACRSWQPDPADPEVAEALTLLERDAALRGWFQQHLAFQRALQRSFRELPVPPGLSDRILLATRLPAPRAPWVRPAWYAAAAAIVLFLGIALFWRPAPREGAFATFRTRMVGTVLRQYTMDIVTNDMNVIRQFLGNRQAPADYVLPPGLASLPASGAGVLSWQNKRVSMVCLDSPDQGTLFLFVVDQSAVRPPRPPGRNSLRSTSS